MSDDLTARLDIRGLATVIYDMARQRSACVNDYEDVLTTALTVERQAREQANQDYRMLHDSLLAEIKAKVQAEQERDRHARGRETLTEEVDRLMGEAEDLKQDRDRLLERLARHLTEKDDPCQDRGASWPCDVARALLGLEEPQ